MAQDDFMDEAGLPVPLTIRFRVRQRRDELEILQLRRDRCQLLKVEEVGARPGPVEEPDRSLLFACDVIGQDRPQRRHP